MEPKMELWEVVAFKRKYNSTEASICAIHILLPSKSLLFSKYSIKDKSTPL